MTRTWLVALAIVFCPSMAGAQGRGQTFAELPPSESEVYVVPERGAELKGRIIAFDKDSIAISVKGLQRTFQRGEIIRIYERSGDTTLDGFLLGIVVGALAGVGVAAFTSIDMCDNLSTGLHIGCIGVAKVVLASLTVPAGMLVGAGIGTGLDALHRERIVLYQRPVGPSIRLAPIVSRERQGLSVSVGW